MEEAIKELDLLDYLDVKDRDELIVAMRQDAEILLKMVGEVSQISSNKNN